VPDGARVVSRVTALEGLAAGSIVLQDVFVWDRGAGGGFRTTGATPGLFELLAERDERVDPRVFPGRPSPHGPDAGLTGGGATSATAELIDRPFGPPPDLSEAADIRGREPPRGTWARQTASGGGRGWAGALRRLGTVLE
jgi:hypothetical protein